MTTRVIEIDAMSVRYGRNVAVDAVSLGVEPGAVYALLGRNGSGKSSLVRCMLGMQLPASGSARLFGEDAWTRRATLMQRVGVVPEDPDAPPEMTTDEIVGFCSGLYAKWDRGAVDKRLERFGISRNTQFGRLSKGQKREVMLSLALASSPELLVLDDPTLGLDVVARKDLFEEIVADLADRGTSIFITTHDLPGIEGIADRVGVLASGRLVLDETVESLKSRHRLLRIASCSESDAGALLAPLHAATIRQRGTDVEAVVTNFDEGHFEELRARHAGRELEASPMSLEEIFIASSSGITGGRS